MSRPIKNGLDYFPFDTDFFSDIKIRRLISCQGGNAILVYIFILTLIYKDRGYFLEYNDDVAFYISESLKVKEGYINEVVNNCLAIGLFNDEIFSNHNVLTSVSIQKRYRNIKKLLRSYFAVDNYNLIDKSDVIISEKTERNSALSLVYSEKTPINSEKTPINSEKTPQIKLKESKIKENKLNKREKEKEKERKPPPTLHKLKFSFFLNSFLEYIKDFKLHYNGSLERSLLAWYNYRKLRKFITNDGISLNEENWMQDALNWLIKDKVFKNKEDNINLSNLFEVKNE